MGEAGGRTAAERVRWVTLNGRARPSSFPPSAPVSKAKILCVAGARPNFMKVAPVLRALDGHERLEGRLVHTGQHYDARLSRVFFEELGLPRPDIALEVGSGSHAVQTAEILRRFEPVLEAEQPQVVVVVGDVNSTLAGALAASKFMLRAPFVCSTGRRLRPLVAHVEAGLRSFDEDMPEEVNRRLTDAISDVLFISEPSGHANLRREGVAENRLFFVGNVMIDSLLMVRERAATSPVLERLSLTAGGYGVVTLHRPSNVDNPVALGDRLAALDELAARLPLVFPVHPRTEARLRDLGLALEPSRWRIVPPLGYVDFVRLLSSARLVVTDSGGIQEETTVLGVPCVTLRESTERPVTVTDGTNVLAGTSREGIRAAFDQALVRRVEARRPELWDGRAAGRIVHTLASLLVA
jgi:UDP-N-acetylglucosamine 2-epimerase (non-hydrolysing)